MKRILFIISILLGLASCREVIIYRVAGERPILFSQQVEVESRVSSNSLENLNDKSFGVRGYKYTARWESEQALATPDSVWLNMRVDCDPSGICTYDSDPSTPKEKDLQSWEKNMRYSFFGYYPFSDSTGTDPRGTSSVTLTAADAYGTPQLIYRLSDDAVGTASNNWVGNRSAMYDVMYGSFIDAEELLTSSVDFKFHHCLTGIQLVIENFSENKKILIESLSLRLKILYRSVIIPMDGAPVPPAEIFDDGNGNPPEVTFDYIRKGEDVREIPNTFNQPAIDVDPQQQHILIIPQKGIVGTAVIGLQEKNPDGTFKSVKKEMKLQFPDLNMSAGTRYVLDIQFLDENVNVLVVEGNAWYDKNSDIEFE